LRGLNISALYTRKPTGTYSRETRDILLAHPSRHTSQFPEERFTQHLGFDSIVDYVAFCKYLFGAVSGEKWEGKWRSLR
jgi:hypothetical protein